MQTYTFLKVFFVLILNLQEYRTEIELLKRNLKKNCTTFEEIEPKI